MAEVHRIAVVLDTHAAYSRHILRGILSCPRHPFHVAFAAWPPDPKLFQQIRGWQPHGVIGKLDVPQLTERILSLQIPTVNVGVSYPANHYNVPLVGVDDFLVGAMGANYFLRQGFQQFAFSHYLHVSTSDVFPFSTNRCHGFSQTLRKAGIPTLSVFEQPYRQRQWPRPYVPDNPEELWLRSLPKPVAIMAANAFIGSRILESCMHIGMRVPDDVTVLGVDNDDLVCLMSEVVLSSIDTPNEQVGSQAMSLMKRLLAGEILSDKPILLPPVRVIERQSSNKLAVDDDNLAAAIRFIRDHVSEPIGVDQIAAAIMVSRRQLEMKFRTIMHVSPAEQIRQERFDQARRLLAETNLPVTDIARRVGLNRAGLLSILFKEKCQMTPSSYREKFHHSLPDFPLNPMGKTG